VRKKCCHGGSRENPIESHKVDPAASSWTAPTHGLSLCNIHKEMIQISLGTDSRRLTTVRQVAHVTSTSSSSVWACAVRSAIRKRVLLIFSFFLCWRLWGRCVHFFHCLWSLP